MAKSLLLIMTILVSSIVMTSQVRGTEPDTQTAFFERMKALCGARFEGQSSFPEDPGDDFRDKTLVAVFKSCNNKEIRIPFHVGENTSRTWILTRLANGIELKHDHRHADGG